MPQVISGTFGEVLKQAVEARISPAAKVQLFWEDMAEEQSAILSPSLEERRAAFEAWAAMPRPAVTPLLEDSRAALYSDEPDRG